MLRLVNVTAGYGLVQVLKRVSLHVDAGEIVTLIGANGAGKTTTLKAISGLRPIRSGEIVFDGRDVSRERAERLVAAGIAQVPEGRQIFRPMSVLENLELGGYVLYKRHGRRRLTAAIDEMIATFPILDERRHQLAGTLSGGEQQMLAIAMTLLNRPRLLLLDEPSMGLAPMIVKEIFSIVTRLRKEENLTVLLVEQNATAALRIADRGYVMETGRVIIQGPAATLLENQEVRRAYLGRDKREIWE